MKSFKALFIVFVADLNKLKYSLDVISSSIPTAPISYICLDVDRIVVISVTDGWIVEIVAKLDSLSVSIAWVAEPFASSVVRGPSCVIVSTTVQVILVVLIPELSNSIDSGCAINWP